MTDQTSRARPPILTLTANMMLGNAALLICLPSLPMIEADLGAPQAVVALVVGLYLLSFALGQLITGPLSDRIGRRPVLLGGLGLFTVGSIICLAAPTAEILLGGRILQGAGACAGLAVSRAVIRDMSDTKDTARFMAYAGMAIALAPTTAPVVGGLMQEGFGWRSNFALLSAIAVILFIPTYRKVAETRSAASKTAGAGNVLANYWSLIKNPVFLAFALSMGFTASGFFAFFNAAPSVLIEVMGVEEWLFGFLVLVHPLGYMSGNYLTSRMVRRVSGERLILAGALVIVSGVLVMVGLGLSGIVRPWAVILPVFITGFGNGLVIPNSLAGSVSVRPEIAGTASALSGFTQMGVAAAVSSLTGLFVYTSQMPIAWIMLSTALIALAFALVINILHLRRKTKGAAETL